MFEKLKEWLQEQKKIRAYRRAERILTSYDERRDGNSRFLDLTEEQQLAVLNKMTTPEQVFRLVSRWNEKDNATDFQRLPVQVRDAALLRLTASLRKILLLIKNPAPKDFSWGYNFSHVSNFYQHEFLFDLCNTNERLAFLNKMQNNAVHKTIMESLMQDRPEVADDVLRSLSSKDELDLLLKRGDTYVWPMYAAKMTQAHILSFIPFEGLERFLKTPVQDDKTVFSALCPENQKEIVSRFNGHPHLLQRVVCGVMDQLTWPVKTEIALQMNNKKFVWALFKTPTDKTGQKAFYATPYNGFRKAVYKKFPELDIYPIKRKVGTNHVMFNKAAEERSR